MELRKLYRLVATENKEIIHADKFDLVSNTGTLQPYAFDFDTEQEMVDKIIELGLIDNRSKIDNIL